MTYLNMMNSSDKKRYKTIRSGEESLARSIAFAMIPPRPIGVWDFLIPVVFIMNFVKAKQEREIFGQNFLFTKKLALDAAFDIVKRKNSRMDVMTEIQKKTKKILEDDTSGVYSSEIRLEQIKEIDLLIDHYAKLFSSSGETYGSLVIDAYQTKNNYEAFMALLLSAENKVTLAAIKTLGEKANPDFITKMRQAITTARNVHTKKIFKRS